MPDAQYRYGSAATLSIDSAGGIPTAATVEILHPEDGSLGAAAAATLPTAVATLTAAADLRAVALTVDTVSGLTAGRTALLTSTLGEISEIDIEGAGGTSLRLRDPLPRALAIGSTVRDHRVTYAAGSALEMARGYRAVWTLTIAGVAGTAVTSFDVVRQPFSLRLSRRDLQDRYATLGRIAERDWPGYVRAATEELDARLRFLGRYPDQLRDPSSLRPAALAWIAHRVSIDRAASGTTYDERLTRHLHKLYEGAIVEATSTPALWYDINDDDLLDADDPQSLETPAARRFVL